jgi:hypothetical protein
VFASLFSMVEEDTMREKFKQLFTLVFIICIFMASVEASVPILTLDQIKVGMKGKGKSVFEGSLIEEFDVEIIGVLKNIEPKKSLILARLRGGIL